jgi:4-hydroxybenzoate polyprenyltransferase
MKRIATIPLDIVRLARPWYSVPMALTFALTVVYAGDAQIRAAAGEIAWATGAMWCVIAAAYMFNDAVDVDVDQVNRPHRPVAAGRIPGRFAALLAVTLMAAGLILAARRGGAFIMAVGTVGGLLLGYDVLSKHLGTLKAVIVGVLMASIYPVALTFVQGSFGPRVWTLLPFAGWMLISATAYEILTDIEHRRGDAAHTGQRNAVQRHPLAWRRAASWMLVAGAMLLLPPVALGCGAVYGYGVMLTAIPVAVLAHVTWPMRRKQVLVYLEFVLVGLFATLDVLVAAG